MLDLAPVNGDTFKLPGSRNCSSRCAPSNILSVSAIHHTLLSPGSRHPAPHPTYCPSLMSHVPESCVSAARPCAHLRYVCALSVSLRPPPLALALPVTRDHPCTNRTRAQPCPAYTHACSADILRLLCECHASFPHTSRVLSTHAKHFSGVHAALVCARTSVRVRSRIPCPRTPLCRLGASLDRPPQP